MVKNSDVQKLKDEISRLMAALEDVNFECQRLEIVNSILEALEEENKELKKQLNDK